MAYQTTQSRRGFTLVELLVVISIIAILAGLAFVGIRSAVVSTQSAALKMEVSAISQAIDDYKSKNKDFPPDGGTINLGTLTKIDMINLHLNRSFPQRIQPLDNPDDATNRGAILDRLYQLGQEINLVNTAVITPGSPSTSTGLSLNDLDASETYVLFLMGLSPDVERPLTGLGNRTRLFEFDETRLVDDDNDGWWSYKPDYSDMPYVYFNGKTMGTFTENTMASPVDYSINTINSYTGGTVVGECRPYVQVGPNGQPQFVNQKTFQVICAGIDGDFGDYSAGNVKVYFSGIPHALFADSTVYTDPDLDNVTNFVQGSNLDNDTDL